MQSISQFSLVQSGYPFSLQNTVGIASGGTLIITYTISGAPATLSIAVQGCKNASSPVVIDTYIGVAGTTRNISISDTYDYFVVLPQWTGGNNVTVTVTATLVGSGQTQTAVTALIPLSGVGSPQNVVAAPLGSIYLNISGGVGCLWVKETGGSTSAGWVQATF
jgi:hypothetical protein